MARKTGRLPGKESLQGPVARATPKGIGATDHLSFKAVGIPGFQAVQDYQNYDVRTHHTNMDTDERVPKDALKQASVVMASVLYHAAMREGKLPR